MIPDFSLLLVGLTLISGLVWLADSLFLRRRGWTARSAESAESA